MAITVHMNDMIGVLKSCSIQTFSDDTLGLLFCRHEVIALRNEDLRNVHTGVVQKWLYFVLNYDKTKVMFLWVNVKVRYQIVNLK